MASELEKVASLSPNYVAAYLQQSGWSDEGKFGAFGRIFSRKLTATDEVTELVVPMKSSLIGYGRRMSELVSELALAEDRAPTSVLFDLALTPFDVIKVRDRDADTHGSIRFDEGLDLHTEAKNLVIAAARSAASDQPRKAWKGRRPEIVNEYLSRVRLGQTERRSFSITVLSPYSFEPNSQTSLLDDDAFGRRVTKAFGRSLGAVERALSESVGADVVAFDQAVSEGVSADLCYALSKLADTDSGIEISVAWSPARPLRTPFVLQLSRDDGAILAEVAKAFSAQEPEPEAILEGPISVIEGASDPSGYAIVDCLIGDRVRRVRVQYGEDQRATVFEAAREKRWVRLSGDLVRDGRTLKLINSRELKVLSPADD